MDADTFKFAAQDMPRANAVKAFVSAVGRPPSDMAQDTVAVVAVLRMRRTIAAALNAPGEAGTGMSAPTCKTMHAYLVRIAEWALTCDLPGYNSAGFLVCRMAAVTGVGVKAAGGLSPLEVRRLITLWNLI